MSFLDILQIRKDDEAMPNWKEEAGKMKRVDFLNALKEGKWKKLPKREKDKRRKWFLVDRHGGPTPDHESGFMPEEEQEPEPEEEALDVDEPLGHEEVTRLLNRRQRERDRKARERGDSYQVEDSKKIARIKREKETLIKIIDEVKRNIARVNRKQEIVPSYLASIDGMFNLTDETLRAKSLRKFKEKLKQRLDGVENDKEWRELQTLMNRRDGKQTNWDIWLKGVKQAFGHGNITPRTVKRIRRYVDTPWDKEFEASRPQKIVEIIYAPPIEQRNYKQDIAKVNEDYEDIVTDWEIKVKTIKNNEALAEEAIEKAKLLGLSLRRLKEGWKENQQDNFWNNPETRKNIQSAFDHINKSIKEYKNEIRQQWKGLTVLWDAIRILTGKDEDSTFNPNDYSFREVNPEAVEQYIELSKSKLSDFIASLGDEPNREKLEESEWKEKVQTILQEEEE